MAHTLSHAYFRPKVNFLNRRHEDGCPSCSPKALPILLEAQRRLSVEGQGKYQIQECQVSLSPSCSEENKLFNIMMQEKAVQLSHIIRIKHRQVTTQNRSKVFKLSSKKSLSCRMLDRPASRGEGPWMALIQVFPGDVEKTYGCRVHRTPLATP